jgi:hypothetical protein
MINVLSFCDSDVVLRCQEFEMAQMLQGLYDLFSGAASAPGNADSEGDDVIGGYFDSDSDDAPDLSGLCRSQQSVERTSQGVSCMNVTDLCYLSRLMRCLDRSRRCLL